jgi:putative lipoic acid-binding regulatory protein
MSDVANSREEYLAKLEALHEFPGPFTFKLFGPNAAEFAAAALAVVAKHLPEATPEVSSRLSGKAQHQCLTLVLEVDSAVRVADLYADFHQLDGLKMLM